MREREDALQDIFLAAQEGVIFPSSTRDRLIVYKDQDAGMLVCGGRVQVFKEDQVSIGCTFGPYFVKDEEL